MVLCLTIQGHSPRRRASGVGPKLTQGDGPSLSWHFCAGQHLGRGVHLTSAGQIFAHGLMRHPQPARGFELCELIYQHHAHSLVQGASRVAAGCRSHR